jgi:hypothetical protein
MVVSNQSPLAKDTLPDSVNHVLLLRLDTLPDSVKHVLLLSVRPVWEQSIWILKYLNTIVFYDHGIFCINPPTHV